MRGVHGHRAQRGFRRDALIRAERHAALCHAVDCAPDRAQHVRRQHGRVLMEGKRDAPVERGLCRADAARPLEAEVFDMRVAPLVHMRDEKRRDHAQPRRLVHLVGVQQLRVDHHRTQVAEIRVLVLDRRGRGQVLRRSRVPVAVRERLHAAVPRSQQRIPHRLVGHRAVTAVAVRRALIGRAHPRGAPLR